MLTCNTGYCAHGKFSVFVCLWRNTVTFYLPTNLDENRLQNKPLPRQLAIAKKKRISIGMDFLKSTLWNHIVSFLTLCLWRFRVLWTPGTKYIPFIVFQKEGTSTLFNEDNNPQPSDPTFKFNSNAQKGQLLYCYVTCRLKVKILNSIKPHFPHEHKVLWLCLKYFIFVIKAHVWRILSNLSLSGKCS